MKNLNFVVLKQDELLMVTGGGWAQEAAKAILRSEIVSEIKDMAVAAYDEFMEGWNSVGDYEC